MRVNPQWTFAAVLAACALSPTFAASAQDPPQSVLPDGHYLLSISRSPSVESRIAIVKTETKDGKSEASVASSGPATRVAGGRTEVSDLGINGKTVTLTATQGPSKMRFEGSPDPKDPKRIIGVMAIGETLVGASLVRTDLTELKASNLIVIAKPPAAMQEYQKASSPPSDLMRRYNEAEDNRAEQTKLRQEILKHMAESQKKAPDLLRAVIAEAPESPHAAVAALQLLGRAATIDASAEEAQRWAEIVESDARRFGARLERSYQLRVATMLGANAKYADVVRPRLESALADAGGSMRTGDRVSALKVLAAIYEKGGKADEAAKLRADLAKLDAVLDEEYRKNVPPFQPEKFAGRKSADANRVLAMELFTGTQCPPCVAADVAFDGLTKTYEPKDVVFLQYHEHIPGPDPLTNPDTVARMDFYREFFKTGFGGTPSTVFNGKADAYGGGGMANSETKYNQYRKIIDPALEESSEIKIKGSSKKEGDSVTATIEVAGLKEPGESIKLVVVLTEEEVRYVGSNNVRFHHHVVRSLFGKAEGVAVKDLKDGKHEVSVNLESLRGDLNRYLDDFAKQRPFANPDRPLAFQGLKIVAMIQDAKTAEILQTVEIEVEGQAPKKP